MQKHNLLFFISNECNFLCVVINLSEEEKNQFRVSFVGKLNKQGHGVKSWKERLVHIVDSRMYYFDINATNKGTMIYLQPEPVV